MAHLHLVSDAAACPPACSYGQALPVMLPKLHHTTIKQQALDQKLSYSLDPCAWLSWATMQVWMMSSSMWGAWTTWA